MPRPVKIGSIIEIKTKKGLAYGQYTHRIDRYGALVRIFDRLYMQRPDEFTSISHSPEMFRAIIIPLNAGVNRGIWEVVAVEPVPEEKKDFPLFRTGMKKPGEKKIKDWWLWDGQKEWRVGRLTPQQKKYPMRFVLNDTALQELIERGRYFDWCQ